ncbi:MAG: hypothetical protein WA191_00910 [Telluria sp.]
MHLKPIVERERFALMIGHALKSAGCTHTLLADSGMEVLRQASKGLPRQAGRILRSAMRLAVVPALAAGIIELSSHQSASSVSPCQRRPAGRGDSSRAYTSKPERCTAAHRDGMQVRFAGPAPATPIPFAYRPLISSLLLPPHNP